jgi:hypothetical protein
VVSSSADSFRFGVVIFSPRVESAAGFRLLRDLKGLLLKPPGPCLPVFDFFIGMDVLIHTLLPGEITVAVPVAG